LNSSSKLPFEKLIMGGGRNIGPKKFMIPISIEDKDVGILKGDITFTNLPMYAQFEQGGRTKSTEIIGEPSVKGLVTPELYNSNNESQGENDQIKNEITKEMIQTNRESFDERVEDKIGLKLEFETDQNQESMDSIQE
jgi:hypothetical protein